MRQYYSPQQLHQASPLPPLSSEQQYQYSPQEITPFNYPQYPPEPQYFPPSFPYNQQQIQQKQQYFPYPGQFEINQPVVMSSQFPQPSQIYPHNYQQQLQQSPPPVYPPPYFNPSNFVRQAPNINYQPPFLQPSANQYSLSQPYPQPIQPWNNNNTANYINTNQPFPIPQPIPSSFKASSDSKNSAYANVPNRTFNYDNQSIFNPITQKRTKRSSSENNNTSLNRKYNPAISAANIGSPIKDQRDQLGRALADQIEDRKRREAAEKEENRKQELNLLNYNLNNSPFIKHSLNHQENLRRRMRENSPQRLPSIGVNRPNNQGDPQNVQQQFIDRMEYPNNIQSNNYQDYQYGQQYQQQYQQPLERFEVFENNFTQNNRRKQISQENKQPRQLDSRGGDVLQEQEKMSKHKKLIEYQRFLQQQIKELNEKKKQEKEKKRQEELRLQREFEQQRIQQLLREQQQQLNANDVRGGRRRIISQNIYPAIIEKQHQAVKQELHEGNGFLKEKEERLLSNKSKQRITKEQLSQEDAFSEGNISGNSEDQGQRLDDIPQVRDQESTQIDRGMMNMINMLSENQLRIQNVLSQIKHSSEESNTQNQMQFANIQEMLKSHHNNRGQQQQKQLDVEGRSQNGNSSNKEKDGEY